MLADLFRAYGKAALSVAGVENQLIFLIALIRSEGRPDDVFSTEHNKLEKKTLGALIREAKNSAVFTKESDEKLGMVLKYRNWMVHHIARDSLGFILQKNGEKLLEQQLLELDKFFSGASEVIFEEIIKLMAARGIKENTIVNILGSVFTANIEPNA